MSSKAVEPEDIPELVHDALVDEHGEGQERRVKGYIRTQSIRELFKYLDPDDVVHLETRRRVTDKTESFGVSLPGSVSQYIKKEELLKRRYRINYDRLEHGDLDWSEVESIIDGDDLSDMAVDRLVYRFEDQQLYDRLLSLLDAVMDYAQTGETHFNQPFHAELKARSPGASHAKDEVRNYHGEAMFGDHGWNVRTLDLDAIWSLDAWKREGKHVMGKGVHQRRVEELAFNSVSGDAPEYGAVNSNLVVNTWKKAFSPGVTGVKEWEWTEDLEWKQIR